MIWVEVEGLHPSRQHEKAGANLLRLAW